MAERQKMNVKEEYEDKQVIKEGKAVSIVSMKQKETRRTSYFLCDNETGTPIVSGSLEELQTYYDLANEN